jgi:hypothetical protein
MAFVSALCEVMDLQDIVVNLDQ